MSLARLRRVRPRLHSACRSTPNRPGEPYCLNGELEFEARGRGTVVVSTACLHSLPRSYPRDVANEFELAADVAVHLRQPLDAQLPNIELATNALAALASFNGNEPVLFQRDRKLVRLDGDHLLEVSPVQLGHLLMLVGIGFLAVLTGAVAERFLSTRVQEAVEAESEVETEPEVVDELREIRARLERLELRLGRR
jgi:hypothetical protein